LDLPEEAAVVVQQQLILLGIPEPQIKATLVPMALPMVLAGAGALEHLDQQEQRALVAQVDKAFIPALLDLTFNAAAVAEAVKE